MRELYKNNPSVEVIEIADLVRGQFGNVFDGVDAVIHTASPLPGRAEPDVMLDVRSAFEVIYPLETDKLFMFGRLPSKVL